MENESVCKNCSWWKESIFYKKQNKDSVGLCVLSRAGQKIMRSNCGLITSPEFGCNQFTAKDTNKS